MKCLLKQKICCFLCWDYMEYMTLVLKGLNHAKNLDCCPKEDTNQHAASQYTTLW